jgi:hypothetical protein
MIEYAALTASFLIFEIVHFVVNQNDKSQLCFESYKGIIRKGFMDSKTD